MTGLETYRTFICTPLKAVPPDTMLGYSSPPHKKHSKSQLNLSLTDSGEHGTHIGNNVQDIPGCNPGLLPLHPYHCPTYSPVTTSEEGCSWSKTENSGSLSKRERNRLRRREERADPIYRAKERAKARIRMQEKRKDPLYRELERFKNRIRMRSIRSKGGDIKTNSRPRQRRSQKMSNDNSFKTEMKHFGEPPSSNPTYEPMFK